MIEWSRLTGDRVMNDYQPIDCGLHSEYELAALQREFRQLSWRDSEGQVCSGRLRPVDLLTRDKAEYLVAEDADGKRVELRLDAIIAMSS